MTSREKIKEEINAILEAGDMFLSPPEDLAEFIDKGAVKQSRTEQILAYLDSQGLKLPNGERLIEEVK